MFTKLMTVIIFGYVAAKQKNKIYIPLVKMEDSESSSESDSSYASSGAIEKIEEILTNISKRTDFSCNLNGADLATKADLVDLKRSLIDEMSSLIATTQKSKAIDCKDIYNEGYNETGLYIIYPSGYSEGILVRCDMDTSGGGWTVIQKRISDSDFYKTWKEYEAGFGNLTENFYIGNSFLHMFTYQGHYTLRVDLESFEGKKAYAEYRVFSIGDAESKYKLHVSEYSGTAGDSLTSHNGLKFSTYDVDNDHWLKNCAKTYHGAWWYDKCHQSNLNGEYGSNEFGKGKNWYHWKGYHTSMKTTEMKLRRT